MENEKNKNNNNNNNKTKQTKMYGFWCKMTIGLWVELKFLYKEVSVIQNSPS